MTACQTNPDMWFSNNPEDIEAAKEGCQDCPLSQWNACRSEGWGHEFGVFGGLSAADRRRNPGRYNAVVEANTEQSEATDRRITARTVLAGLSGELTDEQAGDALPVIMSGLTRKQTGVALTRLGLTRRQVGAIVGVPPATVAVWMYRTRKTETAVFA